MTIVILWIGEAEARRRALRAALCQNAPGVEMVAVHHPSDPPPDHPALRRAPCAGATRGEAPAAGLEAGLEAGLAAGLAAATGTLCMIADGEAMWTAQEARARRALFAEPGAARLMLLPHDGAAGAPCTPRPAVPGARAAALLFRGAAPPPLSALCAPTAILRAALRRTETLAKSLARSASGGASGDETEGTSEGETARADVCNGPWAATILALAGEAMGARAEAPCGLWRAPVGGAAHDHVAARATLRVAAPFLTRRERICAEMRLLSPMLALAAPRGARRLGWRALLAEGARGAARTLLAKSPRDTAPARGD
jgi:hypothetical protein